MEEGWIRLEGIGRGKGRGSSSYRLCPRCCFWDGESVQGSITGIKRRPVFHSVTKMDIGDSYPARLSQGGALVASLARRSRVRFFVVLNWNRKRAVSCFQSTFERVKFP